MSLTALDTLERTKAQTPEQIPRSFAWAINMETVQHKHSFVQVAHKLTAALLHKLMQTIIPFHREGGPWGSMAGGHQCPHPCCPGSPAPMDPLHRYVTTSGSCSVYGLPIPRSFLHMLFPERVFLMLYLCLLCFGTCMQSLFCNEMDKVVQTTKEY